MSLPVDGELVAGRYELGEPLGVGGMAEVRRAWDTVLHRQVAVKLFHPHVDLDGGRRFDQECRALARLSHPGLVSTYDAGVHDRTPFVVLQLVDGPTLRARIAREALSVAEVRRLGAALAGALAHVHEHGVVHRDVTPSNILLDHAGMPYLADFGLAQLTGATRMTRTDHLVGTAAYLAPEQVRGGKVGPPADVYALGLVLLECLTGRREYPGGDIETAVARLHRPPTVPDSLPADLTRVLALMTSLVPRRRPTAHNCAELLLTGDPPTSLADPVDDEQTVVPAPRTAATPSRTTLVASAIGLAGVIGIAWITSQDPPMDTSTPADSTRQPLTASSPSAPAEQPAPGTNPEPSTVTLPTDMPRQPAESSDQEPPAQQRTVVSPQEQIKQDKPDSADKTKKNKP